MASMRKILLFEDETGEHFAWDVSTPKLYEDGWIALFKFLDGQFTPQAMMGEQLRDMARRGNATYAKVFLELHRDVIPGKFTEVPVLPFITLLTKRPIKVVVPEALQDPLDVPIDIEPPPSKEERKNEGNKVALPK